MTSLAMETARDAAEEKGTGIKGRVALVDDDRSVEAIIRAMLGPKGYSVEYVGSGKEALELLEREKIDLVILDVMMPEMDGFEVLKRIKENQETASIPVIMLSGKNEYRSVLDGYKLGADYYISKPFTDAQLISGVNIVLGNAR